MKPTVLSLMPDHLANGNHPFLFDGCRPVLHYAGIFADGAPRDFVRLFKQNGWQGAWTNGVYGYHHYHSNAHEILGCRRGTVTVCLGGPDGKHVTLKENEAVLVPAGVSHKRIDSSDDYVIVGAYPPGQSPDLHQAEVIGYTARLDTIRHVPDPVRDPVSGDAFRWD